MSLVQYIGEIYFMINERRFIVSFPAKSGKPSFGVGKSLLGLRDKVERLFSANGEASSIGLLAIPIFDPSSGREGLSKEELLTIKGLRGLKDCNPEDSFLFACQCPDATGDGWFVFQHKPWVHKDIHCLATFVRRIRGKGNFLCGFSTNPQHYRGPVPMFAVFREQ